MNINQVAKLTGLSAKTIRYYESSNIIDAPQRADNGYRQYSAEIIEQLKFVVHAREVGFSLAECEELLRLKRDGQRQSAQVKAITAHKIEELRQRISQMQAMLQQLESLHEQCAGNEDPNCAILNRLSCCSTYDSCK